MILALFFIYLPDGCSEKPLQRFVRYILQFAIAFIIYTS